MTRTLGGATASEPLRQYAAEGLRPQTLMFTLLGRHVLSRNIAVASSTFIAALEAIGISTQATRSTLNRMVQRGHLIRHGVGRRAYFEISDGLRSVLTRGEARIFEAPVRDLTDNIWTLLSFSIPEDQRSDRHSLRRALSWNGFGPMRNGLWIAPGEVDASSIAERLGLAENIEVFRASPTDPTDMHQVVAEAWDLNRIADHYVQFMERWSTSDAPLGGHALAAQTLLITEWLQILVDDPELPLRYLPPNWPAMNAYGTFRQRHDTLSPDAVRAWDEILESLPVGGESEGPDPDLGRRASRDGS